MAISPMMAQYLKVKEEYKYCVVMFRLGDFYEMFYDDAYLASKELDLTLTGRDAGGGERAPMCGVPASQLDNYVAKLIAKGYKVAVCEQAELPGANKKLLKREVSKVVTPGTVIEPNMLDANSNNYIAAVFADIKGKGFAVADVSTGEFRAYGAAARERGGVSAADELSPFSPAEVLAQANLDGAAEIERAFGLCVEVVPERDFEFGAACVRLCNRFGTLNMAGFGFDERNDADKLALRAAGALMSYLERTRKDALAVFAGLKRHEKRAVMSIDADSRRSLELTRSLRGGRDGSLISVIDKTVTNMGSRLLKRWVEEPLADAAAINARLDAVGEAKADASWRGALRRALKGCCDVERVLTRIAANSATGRDLAALRSFLAVLPVIKGQLSRKDASLFRYFGGETDESPQLARLLNASIADEPPIKLSDGGVIRDGFNADLDKYRSAKRDGNKWLLDLESKEREQTGIRGLKVKFNRIFGYYIEISRSNAAALPDRFVRRQTMANAERYTTDELRKIEDAILSADDRIGELEYRLFKDVCNEAFKEAAALTRAAAALSSVDCLLALAEAAESLGYVRPTVNGGDVIRITNGRHPVVERDASIESGFVPNDCLLDCGENRVNIITGPNMAGKSTYMRQTALLCLMAQAGSFVPADEAEIGAVDRIFTRVGASDDISGGRSTFMVEMAEVANIVNNATSRSLLILDEIGRGTSTYDGLAIAWAVLEHIRDDIGARTMFATHYHEITALEDKGRGVINYHAEVEEEGKRVVFLRKIARGKAKGSYGIAVARLAGLPNKVTARAEKILSGLNKKSDKG